MLVKGRLQGRVVNPDNHNESFYDKAPGYEQYFHPGQKLQLL